MIFESLFNAVCVIDKSYNSLCQFAKYFMQYDLNPYCLAYKLSQIIKKYVFANNYFSLADMTK